MNAKPPKSEPSTLHPIDSYWNDHTVLDSYSDPIRTTQDSLQRLQWRNTIAYPGCQELMGYYAGHDGRCVLDYGCGPGDDLAGFVANNRDLRLIGMDVSTRAIAMARVRLALHADESTRNTTELVRISNAECLIPLPSQSVDYINCAGVLQHTQNPQGLLEEFVRVLKPDGQARVMVYNYDSVWVHLFIAYVVQLANKGRFRDADLSRLPLREAFAKTTDGVSCPVSRVWKPSEFIPLAEQAGFTAEFLGGYFADKDLRAWIQNPSHCFSWQELRDKALADPDLPLESRGFLEELTASADGFPLFRNLYAGVSGVYRLTL